MSTWPLSSYTLGSPALVRLGFLSASALEEVLNRHPGVNVQVSVKLILIRMEMGLMAAGISMHHAGGAP